MIYETIIVAILSQNVAVVKTPHFHQLESSLMNQKGFFQSRIGDQ